jgi:hypothetical protein
MLKAMLICRYNRNPFKTNFRKVNSNNIRTNEVKKKKDYNHCCGNAIKRLILNLSFKSQPKDCVAAGV